MRVIKANFILILIVIFAALLRFSFLDKIPSGVTFDEAVIGINALSIGNGLKDEFGKFLPDLIKIDEDYRNIALIYITAPIVKIFGLNEFTVRSSTALFGVLIIVLTFLLSLKIIKNYCIALTSAFFVAISPWLINLSRSGSEGVMALFFLMLADIFILTGIKKNKNIYFFLAYLSYVIMWFSYIGAVPVAILHLLIFLIYVLIKHKSKIKIAVLLVLLAFIIFPNLYYFLFQPQKITARMDKTSLFADKTTQLVLDEQIREEKSTNKFSVYITRLFHNKPINYGQNLVNNYSQYFSEQFLFGGNIQPLRYYIPDFPLIYYLDIPFLIIGILSIAKKVTFEKSFIVLWLLTGPISAALTTAETPNLHRAVFMLPAWQIISSVGLISFIEYLRKKKYIFRKSYLLIYFVIILVYSYFAAYSLHQFFIHQPRHTNWYRNDEWKNAVQLIDNHEANYSKLIITKGGTEPYYYLMFFSRQFRNDHNNIYEYLSNRDLKNNWSLGKYEFSTKACPLTLVDDVEQNTLFVNGQNCPIPNWARIIEEAKTSDGVVKLTFLDVLLTKQQIQMIIEKDKNGEK